MYLEFENARNHGKNFLNLSMRHKNMFTKHTSDTFGGFTGRPEARICCCFKCSCANSDWSLALLEV